MNWLTTGYPIRKAKNNERKAIKEQHIAMGDTGKTCTACLPTGRQDSNDEPGTKR